MRIGFILMIGFGAVWWDFHARRIPNPLIMAGLLLGMAWQWCANGLPGIGNYFLGALLPVGILGPLHYFRMLGAGDLKYYMVLGGFFGPLGNLWCIWNSFLIAAFFSAAVLVKRHIFLQCLDRLVQYLIHYRRTGIWEPYIRGTEQVGYLHFSLPIFLGSILTAIGGWI